MKKLIEMPEWAKLKRCVLNLGLELPSAVHDDVVNIFNDAALALQGAINNAATATFKVGPGNTYQQAWDAVLAGHQIRQPDWPTDMSWIFENNHQELLRVYGDTMEDWKRTGAIVLPTGSHQLFENWEVLPIIDFESPTV